MGKRIIQRARGKGGPRYRAPSHRYAGKVEYYLSKSISSGQVIDIIHDQGRNSPLAIVKFPNGVQKLHIAPEGIKVGDSMKYWEGRSEEHTSELQSQFHLVCRLLLEKIIFLSFVYYFLFLFHQQHLTPYLQYPL